MTLTCFGNIYTNDNLYEEKEIPYMDSLVLFIELYLYSDKETEFMGHRFFMSYYLKLCDFMNITYCFIRESESESGKNKIQEYIHLLLHPQLPDNDEEIIKEILNPPEEGITVTYPWEKVVIAVLWVAWIYAKVRYKFDKEEKCKAAEELFYNFILENYPHDDEEYFKEQTHNEYTDSAVETLSDFIEGKKELKISQTQEGIDWLIKRNEELKEENEELKEKLEILEQIQEALETSPDGKEWHDKVRLDALLRLMQENGADLEKHGNKRKAAEIMRAISGLPLSTCTNYCTNRDLSLTHHEEEILRLNSKLQALGMKIRL